MPSVRTSGSSRISSRYDSGYRTSSPSIGTSRGSTGLNRAVGGSVTTGRTPSIGARRTDARNSMTTGRSTSSPRLSESYLRSARGSGGRAPSTSGESRLVDRYGRTPSTNSTPPRVTGTASPTLRAARGESATTSPSRRAERYAATPTLRAAERGVARAGTTTREGGATLRPRALNESSGVRPTLRPASRNIGGLGPRYSNPSAGYAGYGSFSIAATNAYLSASYHWGGHCAPLYTSSWSWGCYSYPYRWCSSWYGWWGGCWNSYTGYWGSYYPYCSGYYWWWPRTCYLPGSWFGFSYFDRWCYDYVDWAYLPSTTVIVETAPAEAPVAEVAVDEPAPPAEDPIALAEQQLRLGDFYFKEGRYDEAVEHYLKALSHAPDDGSIHFVLADALFAQGDYHYAAFMISRGLELDPTLATARADKREFYGEPAEFDRQMDVLARYLEEKTYDAAGHLVMGYNLRFSGRAEKAVVPLGRVLEIDPGHRAARALLEGIIELGAPEEPAAKMPEPDAKK